MRWLMNTDAPAGPDHGGGNLSQWIKHEGDAVKAGDVVVEITTDKLTNEITSEQDASC